MPKPRAYAMTHALGYVLDVITPEEHERSEGKYTLALYDQAAIDEAIAEERKQSRMLTDNMLRYAMAALGTGSPAEAERFRAFWLHAMTARATF